MRETIFRGKRCDNGEWVYGDLIHYESGEVAILQKKFSKFGYEATEISRRIKVVPETVGQCTDLQDKNGKQIFEWDIVKWFSKKYTVVYKEGRFIGEKEQFIGVDEYEFINLYGSLEVVGNVHEEVR